MTTKGKAGTPGGAETPSTKRRHHRICRECGTAFESNHYQTIYCAEPCRRKANVRRRTRGCELYDLMMLAAYDSGEGGHAAAAKMSETVKAYRRADEAKRGGRKSWRPWRQVQTELPVKYDMDGDGR